MQNLDKLRLLLLQEVDFWVLTQLERIDEAGVFDEAATVERLDLEGCGKLEPLLLLFLPVAVHIAEYNARHVSTLYFFGGEQQILIACVSQQVFQILDELASL